MGGMGGMDGGMDGMGMMMPAMMMSMMNHAMGNTSGIVGPDKGKDGGKGKGMFGGRPGNLRSGKGDRNTVSEKIYVAGLDGGQDEAALRAHFIQFGTVVEVKMMHPGSPERKGFCFITFDAIEEAQACLDWRAHDCNGARLTCQISERPNTKQTIAPYSAEQRGQMKPGDWICPMCGDLVFARSENR